MGSSLRRQLREVLPDSVKGLPRAVALEIADDARWDDGWRYNPETGRRSKATLSDLVRWTAAKNERVIRDALRNLALAGWEFRVPFGKGADGRLLYAVPGRAAEFRVPDFEPEETVTTVSSSGEPTEETVTTAWETVTTASKAVATASEAVTTGPPSHVSKSHQDPPSSSPAEVPDDEPAVDPDVTEGGGGGGSDLRSIAEHITANLDYQGQVPDKQQQEALVAALVAVLEKGWTMQGLAVYLNLGSYRPDNPVGFYLAKLTRKLPDTVPAPSPAAARGGVRGPVPTAAEYEALTVADVLGDGRPAGPPITWAEASANAQRRMAGVGARSGTDDRVAGWDAVKRELAGREHRPYSNPVDDSIYDEPWTVPAPSRPPWCGELECSETDRMRDVEDANGFKFAKPCEKCHPDRARVT